MRFVFSMVLASILAFGLTAGVAHAGCGKKVTTKGTLKSVDSAKKTITVDETKLTLTPSTKVLSADGKTAKLKDLKGKQVAVISEHGKIDSVTQAKKY